MSTQVGKGHIHSLTGATMTGFVTANLQTLRVSHASEVDRIKGQDGETSSLISSDETFEVTIDFIPEGATTRAQAAVSASFPAVLSGVTLANLPVIAMGSVANVLNASWVYEGGGTINGMHDGKWTATLPLKRYPGITSLTPIT